MILSKLTFAKYLLIFLSTYQFIMGILFLKSTIFYPIFSPYIFLFLFLLIYFLLSTRVARISDKLFVLIVSFTILILSISSKDILAPNFLSFLVKSIQYFYGGLLVAVGIFYILSTKFFRSVDFFLLQKAFLKGMLILGSSITMLEFSYHSILQLPLEYLGHISSVANEYNENTWFKMRSFGIASYPQVSGAFLSILVFLYYFSIKKIDKIFMLGVVAIFLGMTGTGIFLFVMFLPLLFKNTIKVSLVVFLLFLFFSIFAREFYELYPDIGLLNRLSFEQFVLYINLFIEVVNNQIGDFDTYQWLFGRELFSYSYGNSPSHDWAYLGVMVEYGVVGLFTYLLIYGVLIYNSIFIGISTSKKMYFLLLVLTINIHYPTINFYVTQFLFGILFSLNLHIYRRARSKATEMNFLKLNMGKC